MANHNTIQSAIRAIDAEVAALNQARSALEAIGGARRGMTRSGEVKMKVTRNWSPEARKAAAERMKKRWAERRAKKSKAKKK